MKNTTGPVILLKPERRAGNLDNWKRVIMFNVKRIAALLVFLCSAGHSFADEFVDSAAELVAAVRDATDGATIEIAA